MLVVEVADAQTKSVVLDITLAAYSEYKKDSSPQFWQRYIDNIRQAILDESSTTILIAKQDGVIKGSVLLCAPGESLGQQELPELRLLAVPPEYRNQGVADALIKECERRAAGSGGLTLHTTQLMKTAKAMYERRGYVRYPEIDFEPVPGFVVWGYKKLLE